MTGLRNQRWSTPVLASLLLAGCPSGPQQTGEEGETDTAGDGDGDTGDGDGDAGDGDGDTGDGDGDGDTGDGDGDGDGACPDPTPDFEFSYQLLVDGETPDALTLDEGCVIGPLDVLPGEQLALDCPSHDLLLTGTFSPAFAFEAGLGDAVHVRLHTTGPYPAPTWLRVDFPESDASIFLIDAAELQPDPDVFYFPAPWDLSIVDSCGPLDDGCAVTMSEKLGVSYEDQTLELWQGQHGAIEIGASKVVEVWVARAFELLELSPACDPAPDFFLFHRLFIASQGKPVEGDICDPGEVDPCATGLECCYPCGVMGCDFVCTPDDPNTMGCPPPPP